MGGLDQKPGALQNAPSSAGRRDFAPGEGSLMNQLQLQTQLQSLISTVVASSLDRAARNAGKGDLAHGLIAGLRRIRTVVGVQAGYGCRLRPRR
ncbi:MAG: hypothetical protein WCO00_02110 [Rhodospirillaceae bacterium]